MKRTEGPLGLPVSSTCSLMPPPPTTVWVLHLAMGTTSSAPRLRLSGELGDDRRRRRHRADRADTLAGVERHRLDVTSGGAAGRRRRPSWHRHATAPADGLADH